MTTLDTEIQADGAAAAAASTGATASTRATTQAGALPRSQRGIDPAGGPRRVRVGIIGATGYAGGELVRLLARPSRVDLVGLTGRGRDERADRRDPAASGHDRPDDRRPTPASTPSSWRCPTGRRPPSSPSLLADGTAIIDLGPTSACAIPADYPRWYGFDHPRPDLLGARSTGCRSCIGPNWPRSVRRTGRSSARRAAIRPRRCSRSPRSRARASSATSWSTPRAASRAPGREAKPELTFGEVNESVHAYGVGGHRHVAEIEQELTALAGWKAGASGTRLATGIVAVDFLPHLVPMTRGILSACHVRPTARSPRPSSTTCTRRPTPTSRSCASSAEPPATKHVLGSNEVRVYVHARCRAPDGSWPSASIDNLVKGAAGQACRRSTSSSGCRRRPALQQLPLCAVTDLAAIRPDPDVADGRPHRSSDARPCRPASWPAGSRSASRPRPARPRRRRRRRHVEPARRGRACSRAEQLRRGAGPPLPGASARHRAGGPRAGFG